MDWVALFVITIACIVGLGIAYKKINQITLTDDIPQQKKIVVSYTTNIFYTTNKDQTWPVTVYVFNDGSLEFVGEHAETYFRKKSAVFQSYIFPFSIGSQLPKNKRTLAEITGVVFYE